MYAEDLIAIVRGRLFVNNFGNHELYGQHCFHTDYAQVGHFPEIIGPPQVQRGQNDQERNNLFNSTGYNSSDSVLPLSKDRFDWNLNTIRKSMLSSINPFEKGFRNSPKFTPPDTEILRRDVCGCRVVDACTDENKFLS